MRSKDTLHLSEGCVYTCILYAAVVMYMCTAGLTAAAHMYTLYALYPYTIYSDHACNMFTFCFYLLSLSPARPPYRLYLSPPSRRPGT